MNWQEVTAHPSLRDLPFKIELNEYGAILMNPVRLNHSAFQGEIGHLLRSQRPDGVVLAECAIWTPMGTKVADVAWFTLERWQQMKGKLEATIAPEVCVEVVSMSNTKDEMKKKRQLYFTQGAQEVWICDEYGTLSFFNAKRQLKQSQLFPAFPAKIDLR
jgi:Uma2 family endonuclease